MAAVRFLDKDGTFTLDKAENYSYLYLPVANEKGLKAAVTPVFGGDSKVDQNTFLMAVSYTHLDVYKRQHLRETIEMPWIG